MENNNGEGILSQIERYPKSNYVLLKDPAQLDAVFQSIIDNQPLQSLPEIVQAKEEYIQELHSRYSILLKMDNEGILEQVEWKEGSIMDNIKKLTSYYEKAVNNSPIVKLQKDEEN